MICKNCGNEIREGAKFCAKCGAPAVNPMPQPAPVQPAVRQPEVKKDKKKNSKTKAIIAIVLVIALIGGGVGVYFGFFTHKKRLERKLKSLTDKPVIEFYFDDFNGDGTDEVFAVVGKGDKDEFTKGEIWFVSDNADKKLKGNVNGKLNGLLEEKKNKFVSVEVEDKEKDGGSASYIYGVKEKDKYYEPEISGQYQGVHQNDDGKIVDINGTVIGINIDDNKPDDGKPDKKEKIDTSNFVEPTEDDFEKFSGDYADIGMLNNTYDFEKYTAGYTLDHVVFASAIGIYNNFFNDNEYFQNPSCEADPLKKFVSENGYWGYRKVPADNCEWIMRYVLNIEPDENSESSTYLSEGYYYSPYAPSGNSLGYLPRFRYISNEKLSDGRYRVILQPYSPQDKKDLDYRTEIVVALKEIDGKRFWSYYKVGNEKNIPADALEYKGNKYYVYTDACSFDLASIRCREVGGHLAVITSEGEQNAVFDYLQKNVGDEDIWIGLEDVSDEGNWSEWYNGEKVGYTNWGDGEPDDNFGGQDYGVICNGNRSGSGYSITAGQWDDVGDGSRYYLCEWEKD